MRGPFLRASRPRGPERHRASRGDALFEQNVRPAARRTRAGERAEPSGRTSLRRDEDPSRSRREAERRNLASDAVAASQGDRRRSRSEPGRRKSMPDVAVQASERENAGVEASLGTRSEGDRSSAPKRSAHGSRFSRGRAPARRRRWHPTERRSRSGVVGRGEAERTRAGGIARAGAGDDEAMAASCHARPPSPRRGRDRRAERMSAGRRRAAQAASARTRAETDRASVRPPRASRSARRRRRRSRRDGRARRRGQASTPSHRLRTRRSRRSSRRRARRRRTPGQLLEAFQRDW